MKIFDTKRLRVRKLTPKEYGILQAFPMDDWKQVVSDSQAYKQFGNAVTTTVFTAIAEEIAKSIYAAEESEEQNMEAENKNFTGMNEPEEKPTAESILAAAEAEAQAAADQEETATTSENTTTDGSTYQGSTAKERNIVITAEIDGDYRKNRELLYRVFPKGRTGTLEYSEDGDIKTITYRVESVTPGATTGVVRDYTISLICTDPYFKDLSDVEVVMASWVSDWYFENGFDINGVEFGHREAELVKEIENNNGADNIGITAIFRADGIVKNPAIYHSESGKYIKVGYAGNDFELQSGQYVVIFTHTGKKNIYLLDGVSQAEIEEHKDRYGMIDWETVVSMYGTIINQYLDEDGDFIQLQDGTNTITYNAESGINYLSVSVYYRISYLGV